MNKLYTMLADFTQSWFEVTGLLVVFTLLAGVWAAAVYGACLGLVWVFTHG